MTGEIMRAILSDEAKKNTRRGPMARGKCPVCKQDKPVTLRGVMRSHGTEESRWCAGMGEKPL